MNHDLQLLQPYPFEKLRELTGGVTPNPQLRPISLSIGEPKHPSPQPVLDTLAANLDKAAVYPTTLGLAELRQGIADWLCRRFALQDIDPASQILPVNGTREALFSFVQAAVTRDPQGLVVSPNPFYQIYEGAALLAGVQPHYLACDAGNGFIPDFDKVPVDIWQRCQLLFICTPGNPTGAVIPLDTLQQLIHLADQYDFVIASDECYSEIHAPGQPGPVGLLQACAAIGRHDYARCVVFHSLSKRSNLPGLRSGFVAGDAQLLAPFLQYRTYHGCAMPVQTQLASLTAWQDETHVEENRQQYQAKFDAVLDILGDVMDVQRPDAGFYLWPRTPIDDESFTRRLLAEQNVAVVPGRYLSREVDGYNPGAGRIRLALVAPLQDCIEAAQRIRTLIESL
ncbi:succinyldiaminopimelate transaminase [Halopseudomonas yangmingensis]|uniref:Succinyldiaminopimelate aminotransferase apoenzyme n=1 Tax=Halopseudomonas yangmingensis TaxID=1720063 RepID=A0A1I4PUJ2_9GAMM|nr:succinyldiaminopimelate transaminase [Halopseudomonas yangmingensis]SFM31093.1 succinyldiaminopimelate aminotransferase apoenzyme [Halopseudomonas yangmingensis]